MHLVAGFVLLSVVDGVATSRGQVRRTSRSTKRGPDRDLATADPAASSNPRPCDGTSLPDGGGALRYASLMVPDQVAAAAVDGALLHRNSVPSIHMRWSTTANLRASATRAFRMPWRLATPIAQAFSAENRTTRLTITVAAS